MTDQPAPSIAGARRMGAAALRGARRTATERAVRRGGARVAGLDRIPGGHGALVKAIVRALPRYFEPAATGDLNDTFELRIRHPRRDAPDVFSLAIADHRLTLVPGPAPAARSRVTIGADDMVRLVSGEVGWPELLSGGQLSLSGDPFLGLRFPRLFGLPAEAGEPIILGRRA
jgi:hypothetical protein